MTCPTCSRPMTFVTHGVWHCAADGTLRSSYGTGPGALYMDSPPRLVARCQKFAAALPDGRLADLWVSLGIAESISRPPKLAVWQDPDTLEE